VEDRGNVVREGSSRLLHNSHPLPPRLVLSLVCEKSEPWSALAQAERLPRGPLDIIKVRITGESVMKHLVLTALGLSLVLSACASADRPAGDREGRGRHGPPPEAVEACTSVSEGGSCSFTGRRGETLEGTCEIVRDEQLACVPENAPERYGARR
jgi:hypothetical protein